MDDEGDPKLPVLGGAFAALSTGLPPTLDEARENLGGPWEGGPDVGEIVRAGDRVGVVVHSSPTHRDVWVGGGRIRHTPLAEVEPADAEDALAAVAADARVFGALTEGQQVAYEARNGSIGEGTLVEKLRFGGLVGLEDGRVFVVSFRKLAPAADELPS